MRIAILGAGLCGLATAWHLSQQKDQHQITLFSPGGIGKGASGVAAGLLHCYVGAHSKLNWRAHEGIEATKKLLAVAEKNLAMPVATYSGIFRPAIRQKQLEDFTLCASLYPDVKWREAVENQHLDQCLPFPGIFIESGIVVDCPLYLQGLWQACAERGVLLESVAISTLKELDDMDLIIVAMGAATNSLPELSQIKIHQVKGQILEFAQLPPLLPYPVNSQAYIIPQPRTMSAIVGATFERHFTNAEPDIATATETILPKIEAFFPQVSKNRLLDCRAGIRAEMPNRRPLLEKISDRCWVLTGMGSKGLLYHALCAEELCRSIEVHNNVNNS